MGPLVLHVESDLLIVGTGFAGLWAAIAARDAGVREVAMVDKGAIAMSSQSKMSAGATIYCLPEDDAREWLRDVAEAQGFLCHQDMVADMLETSHSRLRQLETWGVQYEQNPFGEGYFRLPSRGFRLVSMLVVPQHNKRKGGAAVVTALRRQATRRAVRKYSRVFVTELLHSAGRVAGALGVDRTTGEPVLFRTRALILACGDCSFRGNYAATDSATGDAVHLAYEAGARLSNMEFLAVNTGSPLFGFEGTGVVLRLGGRLLDAHREPFMHRHRPEGDAAEIGHLVQAMGREIREGNGPPFYLDLSQTNRDLMKDLLSRFDGFMPLNLERLRDAGADVFETPQEWLPTIQSLRGGVRTGIDCRSDVEGLYAAGMSQAFDPGLFNGWSSMRAMWAGERSGREAAAFLAGSNDAPACPELVADAERRAVAPLVRSRGPSPDEVLEDLHCILFPYDVCIVKQADRLRSALRRVESLRNDVSPLMRAESPHELTKAHETRNMLLTAELFLRASLERAESRGDHYREDHPDSDDQQWLKWINLRKGPGDAIGIETENVPLESYPFQPPNTTPA